MELIRFYIDKVLESVVVPVLSFVVKWTETPSSLKENFKSFEEYSLENHKDVDPLQDPFHLQGVVQAIGFYTLYLAIFLAVWIGLFRRQHYHMLKQSLRRTSLQVMDTVWRRGKPQTAAAAQLQAGESGGSWGVSGGNSGGNSGGRPRFDTGTTSAGSEYGLFASTPTHPSARSRFDSCTNEDVFDDEDYFEFTATATPCSYYDWDGPPQTSSSSSGAGAAGSGADAYEYYGPGRTSIAFETWTPPPTWLEASRNVLPFQHRLPLQRVVELKIDPYETGNDACTLRVLPLDAAATTTATTTEAAATTTMNNHSTKPHKKNPTQQKHQHQHQHHPQQHLSSLSGTTSQKEPAFELPVQEIATHIEHAEGGVLQLYVKESSRDEWMEHTFHTAGECAQFQIDLLALQLLGPSLVDMYHVLELLHQGSIACPAKELVLHDQNLVDLSTTTTEESDSTPTTTEKQNSITVQSKGIAWDDVMRCLGSAFPSIRYRLEALWWKQATDSLPNTRRRRRKPRKNAASTGTTTTISPLIPAEPAIISSSPKSPTRLGGVGEKEPLSMSLNDPLPYSLTEDYVKKRLLLGPIDFFRLFVPTLSDHALPKVGLSASRVEQLLRWRKRVARASVLVHSYAEARVVVNKGWNLHNQKPLPEDYWKRRLAFDDLMDNTRWDSTKENEYYEATVSRDVICRVRGVDTLWKQPLMWRLGLLGRQVSHLSPIQAYSLVGLHTFRVPDRKNRDDFNNFPLRPGTDPVLVLPTLRSLIEEHPHLDFFVSCFYPEFLNVSVCQVAVFVRSLPRGMDRSFDTTVDKFVHGTAEERDRQLELIIQMQFQQEGMSWLSWIIIFIVSFLARFSFSVESPPPQQVSSTGDRIVVIPAVRLSSCGDSYHFGGALQKRHLKPGLPRNYVAHFLHLDSRKNVNLAMRIFMTYIARGGFRKDVLDFTYVLAGRTAEELPERALATLRMVHGNPSKIALSQNYIVADESNGGYRARSPVFNHHHPHQSTALTGTLDSAALIFRLFVSDPMDAILNNIATTFTAMSPSSRSGNSSQVAFEQFLDDAAGHDPLARVMATTDVFEKAVNELIRILDRIEVPVRKAQLNLPLTNNNQSSRTVSETVAPLALSGSGTGITDPLHYQQQQQATAPPPPPPPLRDDIVAVPILSRVSRNDLLRYFIAAGCSHKKAVIRLVESETWRGLTFPIDRRVCRVELQNGQFFQQGHDKFGNPILYFRNMLRGYWRRDENASMAAVLHRLEETTRHWKKVNPDFRFTVVVMLGKPHRKKHKNNKKKSAKGGALDANDDDDVHDASESTKHQNVDGGGVYKANEDAESESEDDDDDNDGDDDDDDADNDDVIQDESGLHLQHNPRVDYQEHYQVHTSKLMIRGLIQLLLDHYPERLFRAYVVVGHGNTAYTRSAFGGSMRLPKYISSTRTRDKVKFLLRYSDLAEFIDRDQLLSIAGGSATISGSAFESS